MVRAKIADAFRAMSLRRIQLLALCIGLDACAQPAPPMPTPQPPVNARGQCSEAAAHFAVGRMADPALVEEARTKANAQRVRVVRPGQMVTMEYDAGRLTLELDAAGRVVAARCG